MTLANKITFRAKSERIINSVPLIVDNENADVERKADE